MQQGVARTSPVSARWEVHTRRSALRTLTRAHTPMCRYKALRNVAEERGRLTVTNCPGDGAFLSKGSPKSATPKLAGRPKATISFD
jgi:hypothetical protein